MVKYVNSTATSYKYINSVCEMYNLSQTGRCWVYWSLQPTQIVF